MGHEDEARDIAIFKQRLLTRRTVTRCQFVGVVAVWTWLWRTLFDLFVRYGHHPERGLVIALVIAMVTGWFYQQAEQNGVMVHHQTQEQGALKTQEPRAKFYPYIYSFDVMLPVVKLGEAAAWKPSRRGFTLRLPLGLAEVRVCDNCTQYVVWLETVFGWLAGGILLAVVSGLIKKD